MSGRNGVIPLREWIHHAINSADLQSSVDDSSHIPAFLGGANPRAKALASNKFLTSALKVAWSLADELCTSSEDQNGKLPPPGSDWAAGVAVHLTPKASPSKGHHNDGMQHVFDSLIALAPREGELKASGAKSYLSVDSAEFLHDSFTNSNGGRFDVMKNEELSRIYCLGLVFYEIFSGGERPPVIIDDNFSGDGMLSLEEKIEPLSLFDDIEPLSLFADNLDDLGETILEQSAKKRNNEDKKSSARAISVESLKAKMLPGPLCDLIANMVDSLYGDVKGSEAYSQMREVADDLKLMLDKPYKYMHDLDFEKLSMNEGLHLNKTIFGQEKDLATLQASYQRCMSEKSEIAIISGASGTGKSLLANQLANRATMNSGILLAGKFDQLLQSRPFSAVASAFDGYCDTLVKQGWRGLRQKVASELKKVLGKYAGFLAKVIPNLCNIIGHDACQYDQDQDCVNHLRRLQYLLCQFMLVISSFSEMPIILFIDDLQWADQASMDLINELLLMSGSLQTQGRFYFLGCCRNDELSDEHPLNKMLSHVRRFGVNVTEVDLECMDESTINSLVSDLLGLSPRLTRTLSNTIYHKTKGNPLFISKLIASLNKDGLLRPSLSRKRWVWDEEKIRSRELPNDVAEFFSNSIGKLSSDVQSALLVLSCFGARSQLSLIDILEKQLKLPLVKPLEEAIAEGLVSKEDKEYCFSHDKVHAACYGMIGEEKRFYHMRQGLALCSADVINEGGTMVLFEAAGQFNLAGPQAVVNDEHAMLIANLNLQAGNKCIEMSDFRSAQGFFDNGIQFLPSNPWQEHYAITLQLFESGARSAFATGDRVKMLELSEAVLTRAKSMQDKLNSLYWSTSALALASMPEAVDKGLSILNELGEGLSTNMSERNVKSHIDLTESLLGNFTEEKLLDYKLMTDPIKMMAMKFLMRLEITSQLVRPALQPIVTLKMISLSIENGLSPMSPVGFTYFGQLLARLGNVREGYRLVNMARKLIDMLGSKAREVAGECIALETQIRCYVEPVVAANELHLEGHSIAMASGDINNGLVNYGLYCTVKFWSGTNLAIVKENHLICRRMCEQYGHSFKLGLLAPVEMTALSLIGSEVDVTTTTAVPRKESRRMKNPYMAMSNHFQQSHIHFMFRRYGQMREEVEKFFMYARDVKSYIMWYHHSAQVFISGLISYWVFRVSREPQWVDRGREAISEMTQWAASSKWNFQSKVELLEAELLYSEGNLEKAKVMYDKAISSAIQHRFINDEALACELAGYFFLDQGKKDICLEYFLKAHRKYCEWGAVAKSNALFVFVQDTIGSMSPSSEKAPPVVPSPQYQLKRTYEG